MSIEYFFRSAVFNRSAKNGSDINVVNADIEDVLVNLTIVNHIIIEKRPRMGFIANNTPKLVATPFPPHALVIERIKIVTPMMLI